MTATEDEVHRQAERRLVRKVDFILMPLLTISYGLQYYDKAILGQAAIFGIIKDLGLSTTHNGVTSTIRYSTVNSAFYWGYICGVLPWALLLVRLPLARTLGACIAIWGLVTLLTIVCTNYEGFLAQRIILGFVESAVSPGFVLISSLWYTRQEQTIRIGIWYSATGIFSSFSGIINFGLGSAHGKLSAWKYMYIFAGSFTILWGILIALILPDSPSKPGRFFNDADKTILLRRLAANSTALDRRPFQFSQAKEAARDVKIYLFFLMGAAIYVVNGGVTAFGARIVASFGYTSLRTIVMLIPAGPFTMVSIYLVGWIAGRWKDSRTWLLPLSCIPVIVGAIIIWTASWHHRGVPLFGYYLLATFGAPYVLLLSLSAANVAGSTKRAISSGAIFIGYNVGNIVGPYLVYTEEKPVKYRSTWIAVIVVMCVSSLLAIVVRVILARENARRDRAAISSVSTPVEEVKIPDKVDEDDAASQEEIVDMTDFENKAFRYSL